MHRAGPGITFERSCPPSAERQQQRNHPHGSVGGQQQERAGARMGQPVAPQGSVTWGFLQGCSTELVVYLFGGRR